MEVRSEAVQMCPRYPEPVPLDHPLPILKEALEKVCGEGGPEGHTAPGSFSPGLQGTWRILPLSIPGEGGGEMGRRRTCTPRNGCVKSFSEQVSEQFSCPEGELGWTNIIIINQKV